MSDLSRDQLLKKKCNELASMCKERNLPVSGTKPVLIARILGEAPVVSKPKNKKLTNKPLSTAPVIQYATNNRVAVIAIKIDTNLFEHKESGLIFDARKIVVSKRGADGQIEKLNMTDVILCKEKGFKVDPTHVENTFSIEQTGERYRELLKYVDEDEEDNEDDE